MTIYSVTVLVSLLSVNDERSDLLASYSKDLASATGLEGKGERRPATSCMRMHIVFAYFVRKIHRTFFMRVAMTKNTQCKITRSIKVKLLQTKLEWQQLIAKAFAISSVEPLL